MTTVQTATVDLTQILIAVISLMGTVAVPVLSALAYRFFHLDAQSKSREAVAAAIDNGVALVEAKADELAKEHGKLAVTDANVAAVANYVVPKVTASLGRLDVSGQQLGEVIAARIAKNQQAPPSVAKN